MDYFCKDCSYRGKKSGQDGACPACGSFNISQQKLGQKTAPKNNRLRLTILIGLWVYLIGLIIWKLDH
jgi:predicted ATP-dependent serine protease